MLRILMNKFKVGKLWKISSLLLIISCFILIPNITSAQDYPQLANYYIRWDVSQSQAEQLAKWDVVILDMEVQWATPQAFQTLRRLNPDIKILAYITSQEVTTKNWSNQYLRTKLKRGISESWYLKNSSGQKLSQWPETYLLNMNFGWTSYLANFVNREVMSTGYWDGVFYDNLWQDVSWVGNGIDINNDRKADSASYVNSKWQQGINNLLNQTRSLVGSNKIIIGNGNGKYFTNSNGKLFESFPTPWDGGNWEAVMNKYKQAQDNFQNPRHIIINSNSNNTGINWGYQKIRFGLTSTLMEDGYFAYDYGTNDHSQLWWYDEYNVNLGQPVGNSKNLFGSDNTYIPSVWQRDFSNGVALVNSTNQAKTIKLDSNGVFEKIRGTQDPNVNNGRLVKKVTLQPEDGIILLRKLEGEEISDVVFTNGDFVRVFDKRGNSKRAGFYAYDPSFPGGVQIISIDIDKDGVKEKVVAGKSDIQIFKNNILVKQFYPYGESYNRGINIAVGNVQNDSKLEIVTGTQNNGDPHVKIFKYNGETLHKGWMAYHPNFRGGVQVALGDLNGNGYKEIVTGAGFGGGPHVMIFNHTGHLFDPGFFPYNKNFRGGVNVTCMDLNNDGKDEIITGAGRTGGPHVMIYDKIGHLVDPGFFAFDPSSRQGAKVAAVDIDNDGQVEILGMQ